MWYIYTMEYYSAIKNEIRLLAGKWTETEIIVLQEISQASKGKDYIFTPMWTVVLTMICHDYKGTV
jgi:hypothetical protein